MHEVCIVLARWTVRLGRGFGAFLVLIVDALFFVFCGLVAFVQTTNHIYFCCMNLIVHVIRSPFY